MFPVGTIIPYAGDLSQIPYGWHLCDGTNGTPNLSGRFLEGVTSGIQQWHDAGLPNITGEFGVSAISDTCGLYSYGCFSKSWFNGTSKSKVEPGSGDMHIDFDASKSSNIYGASDTVQPKSYTVYYIMRVL